MLKTAREVASQFLIERGSDSLPDPEPIRSASIRLPSSLLSLIDVFAEHADLSRNAFVVDLLEVGLNAVRAELPPEMQDEFYGEMAAHGRG